MRKYFTVLFLFSLLISLYSTIANAQGTDNDKKWSVIKVDSDRSRQSVPDIGWIAAPQIPMVYDFATVGPNIRPKPGTNTTQSETSVDVHPTNKDIVFASANATGGGSFYGTGVYWSLNGSASWTGFDNPPFGGNSGDPASVIGLDGKFYENYINNGYGQSVAVSTNNGANWTNYTIAPNPGDLADKNHYMVDKHPGSPYVNRSYCTWTDFGGANNNQAVLRYSTNFGQTWSTSINLSSSLSPGSHAQGVNVQTAANGEVYVVYAIYDAWPGGEDAIGFSKSTNGGVNWTHARIYSAANFGIRGNLSSKAGIRVSSFPSMSVDRSGGPYNGTIYITWPQRSVAPAGSDPDIVMIKSTNGGANWTAPVRVNNDPINNGKDQYYPWCTVDQSTGRFMIVFYDSRNVTNDKAEVYMAQSTDGGSTFENFKVSDQSHTPAPISGLAGGYAGDYIGVAALDEVAYPYWGDNRTGNYQGWTAKVTYGPPCPVAPATNPLPANNAVNVPKTLSQLSWTNGAGATQCEVWFGISGNMTMVYSGSLVSSWTISPPLEYNKIYNWQVIEKNDSCAVSGDGWTFTTEMNPGVLFVEQFNNMSFWTPIGPLGTTNWTVQTTANAGGTAPELQLSWTPSFNGLSKLRSNAISVQNNRHYTIELKHMLDWYANPAPNMGLGVSYDNGATYTPIWNFTATGNVGPATVSANFITPSSDSPEAINLYLVLFSNGDSFNIDYWYIDDITLIDADYQQTFQLTVNVANGWNMVSIPGLLPTNQNVNTWWSGRDLTASVFKYFGGYEPVTDAVPGTGYWMKHIGANTYNTGGEWPAGGINIVSHAPITAAAGWNLFGGYEQTVPAANVTTTPPGLISGAIYEYTGGYVPATSITPGYGYWVKLTGAGQINIPAPSPGPLKAAVDYSEGFGRLVFTDNSGKTFTLYAANGDNDLSRFELPPLPPQGMSDVRYSSNRSAEVLNSTRLIEMTGMQYPVTVKAEKIDIILTDESGNEIARIKDGDLTKLNNPVEKMYAVESSIPQEYTLEQNYPNPFNPETTIRFSLPEDAKNVKLTVYNSLGEQVAEIVNAQLQAGYYQYNWNASDLSSGLYIYQLISDKFTSTKKMMLLK